MINAYLAVLPVLPAFVVPAAPTPMSYAGDASDLLAGVSDLPRTGRVMQLSVFGDRAFAVALGGAGGMRAPIVAGGTFKNGAGKEVRIVAFAGDWAWERTGNTSGNGKMIQNAIQWIAGDKKGPVVGMLGCSIPKTIAEAGGTSVELRGGEKLSTELRDKRCDVVVCSARLSVSEARALEAFAKGGHGLIDFNAPASFKEKTSGPPANALAGLFASVGVVHTNEGAEPTFTPKDKIREAEQMLEAYDCKDTPGPEFNASSALDMLEEASAGKRALDNKTAGQAAYTITLAAKNLPKSETKLRERLDKLEATPKALPTPQKPLKANQAIDRAFLSASLAAASRGDPGMRREHAAAKDFPGSAPESATAVKSSIEIMPSREGKDAWQSTGLYAIPGRPVTITVTNGTKDVLGLAGISVRIGCHSDKLWNLDEWKRVPEICTVDPLQYPLTTTSNSFGGLIYFQIANEKSSNIIVSIEGAIPAPYYELEKTTDEQWKKMLESASPWAELSSGAGGITLTIPTAEARKITDPKSLMRHWQNVQKADADLAGWPEPAAGKRGQRFVADVQISVGYMHSGYPIMTHLDAAGFMTDLKKLEEHGWGPYHELGHNHQAPAWTFEGTTEVTCNLFTLYVLETVGGVKNAETGRVLNDEGTAKRKKYLAGGAQFEEWKKDPFLALQMYAMIKREFGWEPFKKVFREYREPGNQRPTSDIEKRDKWMVKMSKAVNKNLGPFFEKWGVPTSAEARNSINDLPEWIPAEMK